jgi:cytochrome c oxidase subunit 2
MRLAAIALTASIVLAGGLLTGCGSGDDGPQLSERAQQGRDLAVRYACTGCHGRDGEGVTAPRWQGLYGSTVQLADGTTVVADEGYLVESIVDPKAKQVAGWGMMPADDIPPAAVAAIIAFIKELPPPGE